MAVSGFNKGSGVNAMERTGTVTGMFLGKDIQDVAAGMKALAGTAKDMMNNMIQSVKQAPQKLAYQAKMAFANDDKGFGATYSPNAMGKGPRNKGPSM